MADVIPIERVELIAGHHPEGWMVSVHHMGVERLLFPRVLPARGCIQPDRRVEPVVQDVDRHQRPGEEQVASAEVAG